LPDTVTLTALVKRSAQAAGFELAGVAPVGDFSELQYFPQWIASGYAAQMEYLKARNEAGELKRSSVKTTFPWARSVIVCAINYNTREPYSTESHDGRQGWIARYAWGAQDYHDAVLRRLSLVAQNLRAGLGAPSSSEATELKTRCYVDTGPVVERVYAKYAGIGWTGKNTCLLNQKLGSWLFLGVILTSLELQADRPPEDRCGSCTRCIDACPTHALVAPYELDANKCISYLTIEARGAIPEALREGIGRQVFGCDICQDVCPWNHKSAVTEAAEFQARPGLVNPALDWLAEMDEEGFRRTFKGSAVKRAKYEGFRRNLAIALGNSGDRSFRPVLETMTGDRDSVVADSARWALRKLQES
jgi:epoxyqueuosine reductase